MAGTDLSFYNSKKYKLVFCLSTAVFFYLFMIFFLPFGVDNYNPKHEYTFTFLIEIFSFFITAFIFLLVNEFLVRPLFIKVVTLKKIVIWSLWTFILISSVIFFTYNFLGDWHDFKFPSYLGFIVNCSSIMIFPAIGTYAYFRYQSLSQKMDYILTKKEASIDPDQLVTFKGKGSKDRISLSISNFLYGKAQDNYVELYYLENQLLQKFLIRVSLGKLIESIDYPALIRCHRSYMVNLYHVKAVKGSQNEISLYLNPFDKTIPVSRTFKKDVLNQLKIVKDFT